MRMDKALNDTHPDLKIPAELSQFARKLYVAANKISSLEYEVERLRKREDQLVELVKLALQK
jgi:hypothetical protein